MAQIPGTPLPRRVGAAGSQEPCLPRAACWHALGSCDPSVCGKAVHRDGWDLAPCSPHSQGTLIPCWASGLTSGSWVLARIYDPELLFISSGSKRFGWEVFQFPPGLDQTAQVSKGESPLSSWVLGALECDQEPHWACRRPPQGRMVEPAAWGRPGLLLRGRHQAPACRLAPLSSPKCVGAGQGHSHGPSLPVRHTSRARAGNRRLAPAAHSLLIHPKF